MTLQTLCLIIVLIWTWYSNKHEFKSLLLKIKTFFDQPAQYRIVEKIEYPCGIKLTIFYPQKKTFIVPWFHNFNSKWGSTLEDADWHIKEDKAKSIAKKIAPIIHER